MKDRRRCLRDLPKLNPHYSLTTTTTPKPRTHYERRHHPATPIIAPIIHDNGTSAARLIEALSAAHNKLDEAYDALRRCAPNGRDYYLEPGRFEKANEQHMKRLGAVAEVMASLEAEMAAIEEQGK